MSERNYFWPEEFSKHDIIVTSSADSIRIPNRGLSKSIKALVEEGSRYHWALIQASRYKSTFVLFLPLYLYFVSYFAQILIKQWGVSVVCFCVNLSHELFFMFMFCNVSPSEWQVSFNLGINYNKMSYFVQYISQDFQLSSINFMAKLDFKNRTFLATLYFHRRFIQHRVRR